MPLSMNKGWQYYPEPFVNLGGDIYASDNQVVVQDRNKRTVCAAIHSRAASGSHRGAV